MSEVEDKRGEGSEDAERSSFRVIDRRRFAADGSDREAPPREAESAPAAEVKSGSPSSAAGSASTAPTATTQDFVISEAAAQDESLLAEPTLSTLLLSLSTQALMLLGEIPDPSTGAAHRDLPAARSIIDLIAVLEKKTLGNLDADESALLDRILYDLRMRFVEISRS